MSVLWTYSLPSEILTHNIDNGMTRSSLLDGSRDTPGGFSSDAEVGLTPSPNSLTPQDPDYSAQSLLSHDSVNRSIPELSLYSQ